jgi:hypothetical protein
LHMVDDSHDGQNNHDNDAEQQQQQQQQQKNYRLDDERTNEGRQRRSQEDDIQCYPPIFINTTEELEKLRYNLSQRPPPYHLPKMIAIDSEWYTINIIPADDVVVAPTMNNPPTAKKNAKRNKIKNRSMDIATLQIAYIDENIAQNDDDIDDDVILIRSFVIDLMSDDQVEYQKTAKAFVSWMIGSSCDLLILGFAFVNDLRQLNKYCNNNAATNIAIVESRCLDVQRLLATSKEIRTGQLPGLKRCSEKYFNKSLRKDDQCSDWTIRPLRPSQLQYAALDAVILLILLSQKKKEEECDV